MNVKYQNATKTYNYVDFRHPRIPSYDNFIHVPHTITKGEGFVMFYNYFTGTTNAGDLAWSLAALFKEKFPGVEMYALAQSLTTKLRQLWNSFGGDFSWADLGGIIIDLGQLIVEVTPADNITDTVQILWGAANLL